MEIRHRTFNPIQMGFGYPTPLTNICADMESKGWELSHIVPHTQYEHIAVFHRETVIYGATD